MNGRPFVHGFELYLEKATLTYESGTTPLTVIPPQGRATTPGLPGGEGELTHSPPRSRRPWTRSRQGRNRPCSAASWLATPLPSVTRNDQSVCSGQIVSI